MRRPRPPRPKPDRNFDVALQRPKSYTMINSWDDPTPWWSAWPAPATSRIARLTVDNPQRPHRPAGWNPTPRTLRYEKEVAPYGEIRYWDYGIAREVGPLRASYEMRTYWPKMPPGTDEQLRTEAILNAMEAVKDQKWNAGVALAESQGVVQMIYDAGRVIGECRSLVRQRRFQQAYREFRNMPKPYMGYNSWKAKYRHELEKTRKGRRELRNKAAFPKGWLYYHFGIKPTIDDISNAIADVGQSARDQPYRFGGVVRGYARHTLKKSMLNFDAAMFGRYGDIEWNVVRSVRVSISVQPKPNFLGKLSQFGVTNPPEAVYNWLPFSWVADIFTTFGDWVSCLDSGLGWRFSTFWSEAFRTVGACTFTFKNWPGRFMCVHPGVTPGTLDIKTIDRVVRGDLYGPMGSVLPTWKRKGPTAQQVSYLLSVLPSLFR